MTMRYWKNLKGEIYWGDRISNADVAVSIQEGEEAYQRYLQVKAGTWKLS
jgi:hypothetical protein